jgi:hypothetical protein
MYRDLVPMIFPTKRPAITNAAAKAAVALDGPKKAKATGTYGD